MKLNEALLIGGALLATLVLSKGGAASSNNKQFSGKSSVPVLPVEDKTPIFQTPQIETFLQKIKLPDLEIFKQFFPVTDTNVQLNQVLNIEEEKKDERISYLQDELDQTRSYITTQQPTADYDQYNNPLPSRKYNVIQTNLEKGTVQFIQNSTGRQSIKDQDIINYYEEFSNNPFHKVYAGLTNYYNLIIAQRNIRKADTYAVRQQEGINLIEEEYQTRFGGLSRYG